MPREALRSSLRLPLQVFDATLVRAEVEGLPRASLFTDLGPGLAFNEADRGQTRTKIETYLAGALQSDRPTHTM